MALQEIWGIWYSLSLWSSLFILFYFIFYIPNNWDEYLEYKRSGLFKNFEKSYDYESDDDTLYKTLILLYIIPLGIKIVMSIYNNHYDIGILTLWIGGIFLSNEIFILYKIKELQQSQPISHDYEEKEQFEEEQAPFNYEEQEEELNDYQGNNFNFDTSRFSTKKDEKRYRTWSDIANDSRSSQREREFAFRRMIDADHGKIKGIKALPKPI